MARIFAERDTSELCLFSLEDASYETARRSLLVATLAKTTPASHTIRTAPTLSVYGSFMALDGLIPDVAPTTLRITTMVVVVEVFVERLSVQVFADILSSCIKWVWNLVLLDSIDSSVAAQMLKQEALSYVGSDINLANQIHRGLCFIFETGGFGEFAVLLKIVSERLMPRTTLLTYLLATQYKRQGMQLQTLWGTPAPVHYTLSRALRIRRSFQDIVSLFRQTSLRRPRALEIWRR